MHRKNRKQIPLIRSGSILVDLDRLRLCTFSLPFTLDPKIVHSFPFRVLRYFPVSILFDILLQIERFLALPPSEKRSWNAFKIGSRSSSANGPFPALHACICFIRFDGREQRSFSIRYSTCRFERRRKKIFWKNRYTERSE